VGDNRGTKLQILKCDSEGVVGTHEEERCIRNLRDNRKERIEVNQEECELRRGNRKM